TGEPMSGATVSINAPKHTVECNSQGDFVLKNIPTGDRDVIVTVSFIGYETQSQVVRSDGKSTLVFRMQLINNALDMVQIVAYGTTSRRFNVGSVATVSSKEIERQPVNNPIEALTGRVSGLSVLAVSGAPNSMVLAQVRGQNTVPRYFTQGMLHPDDFNQPLYLIDGVPFAPQNTDIGAYASLLSLSTGYF